MKSQQALGKRGWFWRPQERRAPADARVTPAEPPQSQRGWWFMRRPVERTDGDVRAIPPALALARDWLVLRGARLEPDTAHVILGVLPDGSRERYAGALARVGDAATPGSTEPAVLVPGAPALDRLLDDVTQRAAGLSLRITATPEPAAQLARSVFASPAPGCQRCTDATAEFSVERDACAVCPRRLDRFVVAGTANGPRAAVVIQQAEQCTIDAVVQLSVRSFSGVREEILRVAFDAERGTLRQPLEEALLWGARGVAASAGERGVLALSDQANVYLRRASEAAGKMARLRALREYRRRQDDLSTTQQRLLIEAPEEGRAILATREREVRRLADTFAVTAEARLLSLTPVAEPLAHVRLQFTGGGEVVVAVDLVRAAVAAPRCASCGETWHVGARCAEGHITCLACQQQCLHCGRRRCTACAEGDFAVCSICSEPSCARCLRATQRRHHKVTRARAHDLQTAAYQGAEADSEGQTPVGTATDALRIGHLDGMTSGTWQDFLAWYVAGRGYQFTRTVVSETSCLVVECAPAHQLTQAERASANVQRPLVLMAWRTLELAAARDAARLASAVEAMRRLCARLPQAHAVVLTTAHARQLEEVLSGIRGVDLVDRNALTRQLSIWENAPAREQAATLDAIQACAEAAMAVRTAIQGGVRAAQARLGSEPAEGTDSTPSRLADAVAHLEAAARVVRQVLVALDTVVEAWELAFAPSPSTEGALSFTIDQPAFEALRERADHLVAALAAAARDLFTAPRGRSRGYTAWRAAVLDELRQRCAMLFARCEALDPSQWREFQAAHDPAASAESLEALAAGKRAELRAQQLREALDTSVRHQSRPPPRVNAST